MRIVRINGMDNERARFILQACRPGGADANDPQFAEALEQARRDPALAKWFDEQQALDEAIAAKLESAPVPRDLKSSILAARTVVRPPAWWRRPATLAWAACLALLLSLGGLWFKANTGYAAYHRDMVEAVASLDSLDLQESDIGKIQRWLGAARAPSRFALPAGLQELAGLGCRVLDWRGKKVTLICFCDDSKGLRDKVHLLVIDTRNLPGARPGPKPQFEENGHIATASWSDEEYTYILAGHKGAPYLASRF